MERNLVNKIVILKVETGNVDVGCDLNGVQIFYRESTIQSGNPNLVYLDDLLQKHGFQIKEGKLLTDHPLRYLCAGKAGVSLLSKRSSRCSRQTRRSTFPTSTGGKGAGELGVRLSF